ncbi:MAG: L-aspartate oxidase, partial [Marmoricola sp.]
PAPDPRTPGVVAGKVRGEMQATMTERVGVLRTAAGLAVATEVLADLARTEGEEGTASWETTNLVSISAALAAAAALREETRGTHWREDFGDRDDADFAGHFDVVLVDGAPVVTFAASPATDQELG